MSDVFNVINEMQNDVHRFGEFVDQPDNFLYGRGLSDADHSTLHKLAVRARALTKFTPATLTDLSDNLDVLGQILSAAEGFGDAYTDEYSDTDHFRDNYTNSDGLRGVDNWTRELVLNRGLDITTLPGRGFRGL